MQDLAQGGYTAEQVREVLHGSVAQITFRYELLDSDNRHKAWLRGVSDGSVSNNALADIKRTANFVITEGIDEINYVSDRIKPYFRLDLGADVLEWPQGIFLLSTPPRSLDEAGLITREVEAYDQLQVLADDKVDDRWAILAGENYISGTNGARELLDSAGIALQNLTATSSVLPTDREWPPGTSKLAIFNDMMGAINYRSLYFDEVGRATAVPYVPPSTAPIEYEYADDDESVMFPEATESLDLFAIPNKWVGVVSESDRDPLRSVYINDNPSSATSTASRDRTITADLITLDAADQASLDEQVARIAFEASQVYEVVEFSTGIMPHHSDSDVFRMKFSRLGVSDRYSEHTWTLPLQIGARMTHRVRRVVSV